MIERVEVIEFTSFWGLERVFLANLILGFDDEVEQSFGRPC
jgi:hypothetical protein